VKAEEEIKLVGEMERGARAERLLTDSMFVEAFEKVEQGILQKWKESPIRDTEGQLNLRLLHKCLSDVRSYIAEVVQTGKLASVSMEHERKLKDRARSAMREFRR
jgi:hypothetical protein